MKQSKPFEPFGDGILHLYAVRNIAEEGNRPRDGLSLVCKLPFDYRTVGLTRFAEGMQENVKIAQVVSVPYYVCMSPQDVVIIEGIQYRIWQVQRVQDTLPQSLRLSLERIEKNYEIKNP